MISFVGFARVLVTFLGSLVGLLILSPLLLLSIPFALVAAGTRMLGSRLEPGAVDWDQLIQFDPDVGWRPKPGVDAHYLTKARDDVYRVVTDDEGWPSRTSLDGSRMIVIGDSYAYGYGVHSHEAFFSLAGDGAVKAVGAPGYNMVQELLLLEAFGDRLRGKQVVWLIYLGNDLVDNLLPGHIGYRAPFVRHSDGGWEVVTDHVHSGPWTATRHPSYAESLVELSKPGFVSDRTYDACRYLIGRARELCATVDAGLTVMTIPAVDQVRAHHGQAEEAPVFDPSYPDRRLRETCEEQNVPMVSLLQVLTPGDYKRGDPHWTPEGHRKVARLLAEPESVPADGRGSPTASSGGPVPQTL